MKLTPIPELLTNKVIVFATDFLENSRLALDYAIGFAEHYKATIVMAHAIELTQPALEAESLAHKPSLLRISEQERLDAMANGVRRLGIPVRTIISNGSPEDVLLHVVAEEKAGLLVLGTHGVHRGLEHLLLGSNVEKILMSSPCPTLTIGRHVMAGVDLQLRFNEVLYVSDFSEEAAVAAPYALQLARDFDAPVDVCQLVSEDRLKDPALQQKRAEDFCKELKGILPDADHNWGSPSFHMARCTDADHVLERAQQNSAGILVLSVRDRSFLERHLHTSFAYELLAKATCPILTVRGAANTAQ